MELGRKLNKCLPHKHEDQLYPQSIMCQSQKSWYMLVIKALRMHRQEDHLESLDKELMQSGEFQI